MSAACVSRKFENAQEAFECLFKSIKKYGKMKEEADDRKSTKYLRNVSFTIRHPKDRIIKTPWRKWNKNYAEREWQWYLSRDRSVEELKKHAPLWDTMHNGNNIVNSNYGWQWSRSQQLQHAINLLKNNRNTRHAWITIYDGKEHRDYEYDTPCTLNIGFSIRKTQYIYGYVLDMSVLMRSNDLIYGFCNDQYSFSKLQEYVAGELGLRVGEYYHYAADMHIYKHQLNMDKL